jgi:Ca2+-binding RTX toxin-like protein
MLESLESRRLMSASLNTTTGLLTVIAPVAPSTIIVSPVGTNVVVYINSNPAINFAASQVTSISITGSTGNDQLSTTVNVPVTIAGGAGNDSLYGGPDTSQLEGEAGNDLLQGGAGSNDLRGGLGADSLYGGGAGSSNDADYNGRTDNLKIALDGSSNNGAAGEGDYISSSVNNIIDGAGNDTLYGNAAGSAIYGGAGKDVMYAYGANNIVVSDGNATVYASGANDAFYMLNGLPDYIDTSGHSGSDLFQLDVGLDTVV